MFQLLMLKKPPKRTVFIQYAFYYARGFCGSGNLDRAQEGRLFSILQCLRLQLGELRTPGCNPRLCPSRTWLLTGTVAKPIANRRPSRKVWPCFHTAAVHEGNCGPVLPLLAFSTAASTETWVSKSFVRTICASLQWMPVFWQ